MFQKVDPQPVEGATALGWMSIGIGLAELAAPRMVQGALGLDDRASHRGILRVLGVREVMHGVGILAPQESNSQLKSGVWARVAGDVLDSALLGIAATKTKRPGSFAAVAVSVAAIGLADLYYSVKAA